MKLTIDLSELVDLDAPTLGAEEIKPNHGTRWQV